MTDDYGVPLREVVKHYAIVILQITLILGGLVGLTIVVDWCVNLVFKVAAL